MRRKELLTLSGLPETTFKMMQRGDGLFFLSEVDGVGWVDVPPAWAYLLCVQIEVGRYVKTAEAAQRVVDLDASLVKPWYTMISDRNAPDIWAASFSVHYRAQTDRMVYEVARHGWAVAPLEQLHSAPTNLGAERWDDPNKATFAQLESSFSSVVMVNLSAVWEQMDARARAAGLPREHVFLSDADAS